MVNNGGLKGLEKISQAIGNDPDMVQGGGGNTSAKLDDRLMAIKASGFKISQITTENGYVKVDYKKILDYHKNADISEDRDFDRESAEVAKENVVTDKEGEVLKPSIETGFHSLLRKYVIHTHSVYANILCCVENGEQLVDEIFSDYDVLWVPYTHPGFFLTLEIANRLDTYMEQNGVRPDVIFLENHGLVVTADNPEQCIELNAEINNLIKAYLNIDKDYPEIELEELGESQFKSKTEYVKSFMDNNEVTTDTFDKMLYPDQIVYLNDNLDADSDENKINIDSGKKEIIYNTKSSEAKTIEETMVAYLYILEQIDKNNLKVKTMEQKYINLIRGMEGEKYRKKILKDMR